MKDYIFVLGRDYKLSILEIISYFSSRKVKFDLKEFNKEVAIVSLPNLNFSKLIIDLGGIVKIAEILPINFEVSNFIHKNKINYSISVYGKTKLGSDLRVYLKNKFKEEGIKAMYKKSKTKQLMPRDLKNVLEFLVYKDFVAFTLVVSDLKSYKERDKRPCNDFLKSTSIRLSKIMINLSGVEKGETLLDPFCGTGVILQEALMKEINVVGIDIDKKYVDCSIDNCEWLKKKYNLKANFRIFQRDSTKLGNRLKEKFDVVVTEPFLGPFIKKTLDYGEAKRISSEVEKLYLGFLQSLKKLVKKKIVLIVPVFVTKNQKEIKINLDEILMKLGFKDCNYKIFDKPILYSVNRGKIKREIHIIQ